MEQDKMEEEIRKLKEIIENAKDEKETLKEENAQLKNERMVLERELTEENKMKTGFERRAIHYKKLGDEERMRNDVLTNELKTLEKKKEGLANEVKEQKKLNNKLQKFQNLCVDILTGEYVDEASVIEFTEMAAFNNLQMHVAVSLGVIWLLEHVKNKRYNLKAKNRRGWTPMRLATARGDTLFMELLWQDYDPRTDDLLLHVAAANNWHNAASSLKKKVDRSVEFKGHKACQVARLVNNKPMARKIEPNRLLWCLFKGPKHYHLQLKDIDELMLHPPRRGRDNEYSETNSSTNGFTEPPGRPPPPLRSSVRAPLRSSTTPPLPDTANEWSGATTRPNDPTSSPARPPSPSRSSTTGGIKFGYPLLEGLESQSRGKEEEIDMKRRQHGDGVKREEAETKSKRKRDDKDGPDQEASHVPEQRRDQPPFFGSHQEALRRTEERKDQPAPSQAHQEALRRTEERKDHPAPSQAHQEALRRTEERKDQPAPSQAHQEALRRTEERKDQPAPFETPFETLRRTEERKDQPTPFETHQETLRRTEKRKDQPAPSEVHQEARNKALRLTEKRKDQAAPFGTHQEERIEVQKREVRLPKGLRNHGNTCYMNSVMQCLYHTTTLAATLRELEGDTRQGSVVKATVRVMVDLHHGGNPREDAMKLLKKVAGQKDAVYKDFEQKEAHDFLCEMLEWLHQDMARLQEGGSAEDGEAVSFISKLFHGTHLSTITCEEKEPKTPVCSTTETFSNLSLTITEPTTLEDAVDHYYRPQQLEWDCDRCGREHMCQHRTSLTMSPPVLILHLNRSTQQEISRHKVKVLYPEVLDVELNTGERKSYKLFAMCCHDGSMSFGHYTAYCRNGDQWYHFNDTIVTKSGLQHVFDRNSAHILFYEVEDS